MRERELPAKYAEDVAIDNVFAKNVGQHLVSEYFRKS